MPFSFRRRRRWFCCHPEIVLTWWRHVIFLLSIEHALCYDVCLMKFNEIFLDDTFLMYDIIVFEIPRVHTYTRKRKAGVFKNLNSGELFWKGAFSVTVFTGYEWTVGQTGGKKSPFFEKNGFVWMGPNIRSPTSISTRPWANHRSDTLTQTSYEHIKSNMADASCAILFIIRLRRAGIENSVQICYSARAYVLMIMLIR